jgi:membrane-bound ClpP family serine protease
MNLEKSYQGIKVVIIILLIIGFTKIFLGLLTPLSGIIFSSCGLIFFVIALILTIKSSKVSPGGNQSVEERLKQLEDIKSNGLITIKEYEMKRSQILEEKW